MSKKDYTAVSIMPHDKIIKIFNRYLTEVPGDQHYIGMGTKIVMDETLFDFGNKYRLVIHRVGNGNKEGENYTNFMLTMHIFVIKWDEVKDFALVALRRHFGNDAVVINDGDKRNKYPSLTKPANSRRYYSDVPQLNFVHPDYSVTIQLHVETLTISKIKKVASIKGIIIGERLRSTLATLATSKSSKLVDHPECSGVVDNLDPFILPVQKVTSTLQNQFILVCPARDRVTIVFPVYFEDTTDEAIAKLFMQQFKQAPHKVGSKSDPFFDYRRGCDPPLEFAEFFRQGSKTEDFDINISGFVTFTFLEGHLGQQENIERVTENMLMFIDFLDYHIKYAKSYLHKRMRTMKDTLLKCLI